MIPSASSSRTVIVSVTSSKPVAEIVSVTVSSAASSSWTPASVIVRGFEKFEAVRLNSVTLTLSAAPLEDDTRT